MKEQVGLKPENGRFRGEENAKVKYFGARKSSKWMRVAQGSLFVLLLRGNLSVFRSQMAMVGQEV